MWKNQGQFLYSISILSKEQEAKFQRILYVNYKSEEFLDLLVVMDSVYCYMFTILPIWNVLQKIIATVHCLSFFFLIESE